MAHGCILLHLNNTWYCKVIKFSAAENPFFIRISLALDENAI
jgi:hypothetical protein